MADRCAGCTNKFKFREKPAVCAKCGRNFCTLCIPKSKHKKNAQAVRETCIYCTRKVQEAMRQQEAGVMENFPDRFYHSPHVQAPVVTKLRLNEEKLPSAGGLGGGVGGPHSGPVLTEEDRKLEERLRRLKESHRPTKTGDSEAALQERLAKLRDEGKSQGPPSSTGNQSSGPKTESEQADNLVDEVSDRVGLDRKVDPNNYPMEDSITTLLGGMDIQVEDADPNKLFEEFRAFQSRQEQSAMADATSKDVQDIVVKAKELQRDEQEETGEKSTAAGEGFITPYPQLPPVITVESHGEQKEKEISVSEITQVLAAAQREMEQDENKQKEIDQFVSAASKQLAELRSTEKTEGDSEVRSKPEPARHGRHAHLDFSWGHFGSGGAHLEGSTESGVGGDTAARQLGITLSSEVILDETTGTDSGDEVSGLLKQTLAEAALDRRLEEKGLDRYLKPSSGAESRNSKGGAVAGGSGEDACAATNYRSGWGGVDPDDLPWCCICNADAHIRCYDCDNDLYCTQCFSEGHEQFGLFDHKYAPFEPLTSRAV